ncbi:MAG: hypothetical protein A3J93_03555 [Candidatus Magasanikbacteria bacterium RIFOXYC2_FULL_42_28]|uniref:Polymerase nucleotidyl transferase domain-containing protein n=1 Tax=Candidatus Magasanikbacteria bacterium RIFOXYC2_FULL_42_28 TaxID=1798704 RepID=A0A1F6NVB7_9BACT|nr:MAG: hypothetical protein A3J93_03555 [Candidatus Magasanikbacteria bacterium RIFOXYC2_FULL_42_28]
MNKLLQQAIIRTLTYFDIVKKSLTRAELFSFLWQPPFVGREEFNKYLEENTVVILSEAKDPLRSNVRDSSATPQNDKKSWQAKDGLYFLPGHDEFVEKRAAGREHSDRLLKIAVRAVKKIRSIPFVRAIFVCNSVGSGTASDNSDVDLFIITAPKRVWLVRFFTNITMLLFGLRRHGDKVAGKVCLSFLVDEKKLNMAPWRVCDDDIYLAYWLFQLIPLYDPNNLYDKLIAANGWVKKYLPNVKKNSTDTFALTDSVWGLKWKNLWEKFWTGAYGDLIENQARGTQQAKMKFSSHGKVRPHDKSVIVGEGVIKLHEGDTREELHRQWLDAISE